VIVKHHSANKNKKAKKQRNKYAYRNIVNGTLKKIVIA